VRHKSRAAETSILTHQTEITLKWLLAKRASRPAVSRASSSCARIFRHDATGFRFSASRTRLPRRSQPQIGPECRSVVLLIPDGGRTIARLSALGQSRHAQCKEGCPLYPQKRRLLAKRFNELPKLDGFFRAGAVPIISVPLALRRTTASAMHPADLPTSHRRRTAGLARSL
jgi:hypothetical protein